MKSWKSWKIVGFRENEIHDLWNEDTSTDLLFNDISESGFWNHSNVQERKHTVKVMSMHSRKYPQIPRKLFNQKRNIILGNKTVTPNIEAKVVHTTFLGLSTEQRAWSNKQQTLMQNKLI